jgi:outer membrane protein W
LVLELNSVGKYDSPEDDISDMMATAGVHTHVIAGNTGTGTGSGDAIDVLNPVITMQWYIKL